MPTQGADGAHMVPVMMRQHNPAKASAIILNTHK